MPRVWHLQAAAAGALTDTPPLNNAQVEHRHSYFRRGQMETPRDWARQCGLPFTWWRLFRREHHASKQFLIVLLEANDQTPPPFLLAALGNSR